MAAYLRIYMNDQLALGIAWRELVRRSERSNRGTELGDALARVAAGIAEDVETFEELMRRLGLRRNPVKKTLALVGERAGRLKLNARVRSYSHSAASSSWTRSRWGSTEGSCCGRTCATSPGSRSVCRTWTSTS